MSRMSGTLLLVLLISPSFAHRTLRYSGTHHQRITSDLLREDWFDSPGDCARLCMKVEGCGAYSTQYLDQHDTNTIRGYKCHIGGASYTSSSTPDTWVLWEPQTKTGSARRESVVSVVSSPSREECPVVWRMWPGDNNTLGTWSVKMSSTDGGHVGSNVLDSKNTTKAKTGEANYPWLQVDLGRKYRVTKVAVLSGEEPIMNMDIRVGMSDMSGTGTGGDTRITSNDRCGIYYGPTVVSQQWVEVDCGFSHGMVSQFIGLQMTERFLVNNPLEMTMLEVYGWGRVCGSEDP